MFMCMYMLLFSTNMLSALFYKTDEHAGHMPHYMCKRAEFYILFRPNVHSSEHSFSGREKKSHFRP